MSDHNFLVFFSAWKTQYSVSVYVTAVPVDTLMKINLIIELEIACYSRDYLCF